MERKETYKRKERSDLIYGLHPVLEAINADRELNKILIQKGISKDVFRDLKDTLAGKDFQLQFVPVEKINSLTQGNHLLKGFGLVVRFLQQVLTERIDLLQILCLRLLFSEKE